MNADGSGARDLDVGIGGDFPAWHPRGDSLLFRGTTDEGVPGLYTIDLSSDAVTGPILSVDATTPLFERWGWTEYLWEPRYSPDGSAILYSTVVELTTGRDPLEQQARARIVDADGTNIREIAVASDSRYEMAGGWSPDGSRFLINVERAGADGASQDPPQSSVAIVSVADAAVGVATEPAVGDPFQSIWAPDGSIVLIWGGSPVRAALVDTSTGAMTHVPWDILGVADWQPVAR